MREHFFVEQKTNFHYKMFKVFKSNLLHGDGF